jgi:hypothetical protein
VGGQSFARAPSSATPDQVRGDMLHNSAVIRERAIEPVRFIERA